MTDEKVPLTHQMIVKVIRVEEDYAAPHFLAHDQERTWSHVIRIGQVPLLDAAMDGRDIQYFGGSLVPDPRGGTGHLLAINPHRPVDADW